MGMYEGKRVFKTGAEAEIIRGQEATTSFSELIDASRIQAKNFAEANPLKISAFKSQKFDENILNSSNQAKTAYSLARSEPSYLPEYLDGIDDQAAFLVALAEHLQAPEYNQ